MKFLADLFPIILFFVGYKLWGIYVATAIAIAAALIQVGYHWFTKHRVENMQWVTLGLLVVFGGLTIALRDPLFVMWKPSVLNWLFAAAFFFSRYFGEKSLVERMMGHAVSVPKVIWSRLNTIWVLFFLLMGALNLFVASYFFTAEAALKAASGLKEIDLGQCANLFTGEVLELCRTAQAYEENWVNFKLFGLMGLTLIFVIAQAIYLARHMKEDPAATDLGN